MLPQTRKKRLSKRGVSVVIGYVLLVSVAVVLGGVMYAWMKSYVPKESLDCPEGSALSIKSYVYNCSDPSRINLTIVNNEGLLLLDILSMQATAQMKLLQQ